MLRLADAEEVASRWSSSPGAPEWQTMFPNECHVRCELGRAGDHLMTFGRRATFHLDREGRTLLCAPVAPEQLDWRRFLLDTALCCVSSIVGFETLHASAVRTQRGIAAFVASPDGGKSTIAAEMISRGQDLVCDDVLALGRSGQRVVAYPGPPLMALAPDTRADREMGDLVGGEKEDGKFWVRINRAGAGPEPLAGIFILERHRPLEVHRVLESSGPGRLLPHTLSLDRDPARALSRLGLLRELAASVPVYRVGAPEGGVAEVADAVEATLSAAAEDTLGEVGHVSAA